MKSLTTQFVTYFNTNDKFKERLSEYDYILKTKEWKFFKDVLITIKGTMMQDMLSHKFTDLPEKEKDVMQRTYFHINEMLDFLSNPNGWVEQRSRFSINPIDLLGKVNAKLKREGGK